MKFTIALSTLLLCVVTLASTVLFWSSMPTDQTGKLLAAITATALEACKYSFFPAGVYYLKKRNAGGALLLIIGVVLVGISVAATTGFLENAYNQQTQMVQQNSLEYQTKKQQLNSLQQQIDSLNSLVAADAQGSYRTRAIETAKQVKVLEQQRDNALAEIKGYRETAQGNAQSLFSVLAIPLGASPEAIRQSAFIGLAVIVDICAIAGLLALGGIGKKPKPEPKPIWSEPPTNTETIKEKKPVQVTTQKPVELTEPENELAEKILAGIYGQPPAVRRIITEANVRHGIAKKVLEYLVVQNKVRREGKQYQLVQSVIS
jgi:predicted transcriptional regulator